MTTPTTFLTIFLEIIVLRYAIAELRITEQPQNASIFSGQTHILNCKFNDQVNCTWHREGIIVEINLRYRYTTNNGTDTAQCSIEISNFNKMDASRWLCKNKAIHKEYTVVSEEVFLSIKNPEHEEKVTILLNKKSISRLEVSSDTPWRNLECVVESIGPIQSLQWALGGQVIPNAEFSSNCSVRDTLQLCYSSLAWSGGWEPLFNSTYLSCFTKDRNLTSTVTLYRNALPGNDTNVHDNLQTLTISDASSTTKIVFFSLLATASVVLLLVIVISILACYRPWCKCPDPDPGLFESTDELGMRHRCSSVLRLSQQEAMIRTGLSIQNPLYKTGNSIRSQKAPQDCVLMADQRSRYSNPEALPHEPSYLELYSCQPFHACDCPCHLDVINLDYCTGNCNSNAQTTYFPCRIAADDDSEARDLDSEELYTDGQSTLDANGPKTKSRSQMNVNSAPKRNVGQAPSCPNLSAAYRPFSEDSLYEFPVRI